MSSEANRTSFPSPSFPNVNDSDARTGRRFGEAFAIAHRRVASVALTLTALAKSSSSSDASLSSETEEGPGALKFSYIKSRRHITSAGASSMAFGGLAMRLGSSVLMR